MKDPKTKSFFAGIVFAFILFISFSFITGPSHEETVKGLPGTTSVGEVSPQQALTYRNNYTSTNQNALTAVNISVAQWEAINASVTNRGTGLNDVAGFRIYFGNTSSRGDGQLVAIPYFIDNQLNEMPPAGNLPMAQNFPAVFNSQCPPFCD